MLTLYTLPICPRCDMIKAKLTEAKIDYMENRDPAKAEEFSDRFWPIGVDENGTVYEFPQLLEYIKCATEPYQQITMEELLAKGANQ